MKLHSGKTLATQDIVKSSVKEEKRSWITRKQSKKSLQDHLFIIHDHSISFPNAGSLEKSLRDFQKRIIKLSKCDQVLPLISIVVDISYRNPRTYPICIAIISDLLGFLNDAKKIEIINKIKRKFDQLPNTGHLDIWLQRITHPVDPAINFNQPLCRLVSGSKKSIWNNDWIGITN